MLLKFCFVPTIATCECPLWAKAFVLGLILLVSTIKVPHRSIHWSHTVHKQLVHKPGIYQIKQFYLPLSELLTLHPLQILLQFLLWCGSCGVADGCKLNILFSYVLMICRLMFHPSKCERGLAGVLGRLPSNQCRNRIWSRAHRSRPVCDQ